MADEKEVKEIGKNCPSCKKIMKKKKRYYRENAYYCNKNCYKNAVEKALAAKATAEEAK